MRPLDFFASEPHFLEHLAPIWRALDLEERGVFYVRDSPDLEPAAVGVKATRIPADPPAIGNATVVAAFGDLKRSRRAGRPVVLSEHGAGQSYTGVRSGSYVGAADRDGVVLVLVPGELAAGVHRAAHPDIPVAAIGCPKLDHWHRAPARPRPAEPTVAISFHWDAKVCPETRSAFPHFKPALLRLARTYRVLGHGHPRMIGALRQHYAKLRIEAVPSFEEVIARADVYVIDNSSTLYEFASLDRPVVVLNAPQYRRHVRHGLRFWDFAGVGPQVDEPAELVAGVAAAWAEPDLFAGPRARATEAVYAVTDGTAAARAAAALRSHFDGIAPELAGIGENQEAAAVD